MKTSRDLSFIWWKHLADTDHLLAELSGLLHEGGSEDRHGHGQHSLHQSGAVLGVTILTTETVSLEISNTLSDSLLPGHVVSGPGQDVSALLTGPVTDPLKKLHLYYYCLLFLAVKAQLNTCSALGLSVCPWSTLNYMHLHVFTCVHMHSHAFTCI